MCLFVVETGLDLKTVLKALIYTGEMVMSRNVDLHQ